jgi:hypothetical protein
LDKELRELSLPVDWRQRTGASGAARNTGRFGRFFLPVSREAQKMTALSSIEYPHWLMIAGALLLILGFIGLALRLGGPEAEPDAIAGEQETPEPEADLDQVEVYNRTAKKKRRDRWAERFDDSEEAINSGEEIGQGSK